MPAVLAELAAELAEEGLVGELVRVPSDPTSPLTDLLAAGPRTAGQVGLYARVVECVREGYLLHYGQPRLLAPPDADTALLAGDYLYAKGIGLLAEIGDLEAVAVLAELISASAELNATGSEEATERAGALWLAAVTAIAIGPAPADIDAITALRAGGSASALYSHASDRAARAGLGDRMIAAAETVGFSPLQHG